MRCEYTEIWSVDGEEFAGQQKTISLPIKRVSSRAIILRKRDGAILGTLHRRGGRYALPGGSLEDGETTLEAVLRELDEENIHLVDPDESLEGTFAVDYFDGYGELRVWHFLLVVDAHIGVSEENIGCRWVFQGEDIWYPQMRERLLMEISKRLPNLVKKMIQVI